MKITIQHIGIIFFAALVLAGCRRGFEEINSNPNQPSSVATSFLLTSAQKQLMDHTWDEWWNGRRGNQLAQYWASNQYSSESRYQLRTSITNNYWIYFYAGRDGTGQPNGGGMADLNEIIRLNTEFPEDYAGYGSNDNQIAVAMIMKSWVFQMLTDCFGAIPYSESLQGAENPSPGYDSQETVYRGILADLAAANNMIQLGEAGPQGDAIYGGDMAQWKMFCNSLRMRVAMRAADAMDVSSDITDAVSEGVMSGNGDSAMFPYISGQPNNNPINEDYLTRNDFAASNVMVDKLTDLADPRIGYFYAPAVNTGTFVGEVYGLTEEDAALTPNDAISQRSAKVLAADFPGIYMNYSEVQFLLAEAVERGYISGSASDYYEEGVRSSMDWWSGGAVSSDDVDAYLAQTTVNYDDVVAASSWSDAIGTQKWIALYMQGIQGWTEWRRLDFGILQEPAGGVLAGSGIPLRFQYPLDEQTLNGDSYSAAVEMQGADALDTKLWWDVD